ncbi:lysozyme-like domain-containing protein [Fimicolochytrium jonesii]|uniref:lysozyme-like domain-containing protein n=1 Tax=Fimicolochytrium jonesii TaxID=1396493 RepID=UPI0022FE99AA|nr:lysozyme-like domain-containing protein [Fimicolochytrium jonesii]KAI8822404.1 lysozyme-like domain-containing protein [Fimicolochytrium jonesii]
MHPPGLTTLLLGFLATAATPALAALTPCQKSLTQQLTNEFENSRRFFSFDYCEDIGDGRGYTAGMVGFTTATHDAFAVVSAYKLSPNYTLEFDSTYDTLLALNQTGSSSTSGLADFCPAWRTAAATNPSFRALQVKLADEMYFNPAEALSDTLGLTLPLARAQLYDAAVQMGIGNDTDSVPAMAARIPSVAQAGSEDTWLSNFLTERARTLCNPAETAFRKSWCPTLYRTNSYTHLLTTSQSNFTETFTPLDNDGHGITLNCDLAIWDTFVPLPVTAPGGGGLSTAAKIGIAVAVIVVVLGPVAVFLVYTKRRFGAWGRWPAWKK